MILEATAHDTAAGDIAAIRQAIDAPPPAVNRHKSRKILLAVAAVVCLLTVSLSAATLLSGFGEGFQTPLEPGNAEIVPGESTNRDVEWKITEVWFDEYNLFIGGTLITPEPLEVGREYNAKCRIGAVDEPLENLRYVAGNVRIYPNGTTEIPFLVERRVTLQHEGDLSIPVKNGIPGDSTSLQIIFSHLHDHTRAREENNPDGDNNYEYQPLDYLVYPGEWAYVAEMTSGAQGKVELQGPFAGKDALGGSFTVDSVYLTRFTLEINGDNLKSPYHSAKGGIAESDYIVWLKMKDGTLALKGHGAYSADSIHPYMKNQNRTQYVITFHEPLEVEQIESILLVTRWASSDRALDSRVFNENRGYTVIQPAADTDRHETWFVACEIPLP